MKFRTWYSAYIVSLLLIGTSLVRAYTYTVVNNAQIPIAVSLRAGVATTAITPSQTIQPGASYSWESGGACLIGFWIYATTFQGLSVTRYAVTSASGTEYFGPNCFSQTITVTGPICPQGICSSPANCYCRFSTDQWGFQSDAAPSQDYYAQYQQAINDFLKNPTNSPLDATAWQAFWQFLQTSFFMNAFMRQTGLSSTVITNNFIHCIAGNMNLYSGCLGNLGIGALAAGSMWRVWNDINAGSYSGQVSGAFNTTYQSVSTQA